MSFPCLTGLSMATTRRRSTLWRSICTILRWSKGKVAADRCSLMWIGITPSSSCLMLLNARLCAHDSASSLNWNRLLRIQLYKLIGCVFVCLCVCVCVCVHMCMEAHGKTVNYLPGRSALAVTLWVELCCWTGTWQRASDSHSGREGKRGTGRGLRRGRYKTIGVREREMKGQTKMQTALGKLFSLPWSLVLSLSQWRGIQGKGERTAKEGGKKQAGGKKGLRETRRKKRRRVWVASLAFLHPSSAPRLWSVSQSVSTVLWPLKGKHDSRTELKYSHSELLPIRRYLPSKYCRCEDFCGWWFLCGHST